MRKDETKMEYDVDTRLNLWQTIIVLLFLRLPPNMDGFLRGSKHYNAFRLRYYERHKGDIPLGWLTWRMVGIAALDVLGAILFVCCLVFAFIIVCACTDYNWVPGD